MKNDTLLECGSENSATIITCVAGSGEADSSNPSLLLSRQEFHRRVIETQTRLRGYALFLCGSHPAAEELLRLVKKRRSMTNKDNAKLTDQIRSLIKKWK